MHIPNVASAVQWEAPGKDSKARQVAYSILVTIVRTRWSLGHRGVMVFQRFHHIGPCSHSLPLESNDRDACKVKTLCSSRCCTTVIPLLLSYLILTGTVESANGRPCSFLDSRLVAFMEAAAQYDLSYHASTGHPQMSSRLL